MDADGVLAVGARFEVMAAGRPLTLRELLRADTLASCGTRKSPLFYLAAAVGLNKFSVVLLFRVASTLHGKGALAGFISGLLTRINCVWNSSELSPAARIGPGLHVPHPLGVGFGPITAGSNLTILQHASLGLRDRKLDHADRANYPTLGNDVEVGPGTAILGPVQIGDGATIGANAVVLQDVPARGIAVGNPARIVERRVRPVGEARSGTS